MLIIAIATSPADAVTHHVARDETGSAAYRRLRPLLPVGTQIDTMSVDRWLETRGPLALDLRPLDALSADDRDRLERLGARLIDPSTPPPAPDGGRRQTHRRPASAAPAPPEAHRENAPGTTPEEPLVLTIATATNQDQPTTTRHEALTDAELLALALAHLPGTGGPRRRPPGARPGRRPGTAPGPPPRRRHRGPRSIRTSPRPGSSADDTSRLSVAARRPGARRPGTSSPTSPPGSDTSASKSSSRSVPHHPPPRHRVRGSEPRALIDTTVVY